VTFPIGRLFALQSGGGEQMSMLSSYLKCFKKLEPPSVWFLLHSS